jgi:type II secretion system protein N
MALIPKNNKWLGYTLYVVLVTLALLYFLFPAQTVEELFNKSITGINPELHFKAEKIGPWIPPGLKISDGEIYLETAASNPVFKADSLNIRPQFIKLLGGKYNVSISGTAYKGEIKGSLLSEDKEGKTIEGELSFKDFELALYSFLAEKLPHRVSGLFSGKVVYARDAANPAGSGKANLRLSGGQLQFENPILGIDSVDLQNIDLELELRNRYVTVVKGELTGSELNASVAGSIQLSPDLKSSQLNLKGTMEPLAEFYRKYPEIRELLKSMKKRVKRGQYFFAVTGTLGQPRFSLL